MTTRGAYNYTYDSENRMTGVSGLQTASFVYDGDGNRVKATVGGVTITYIGNYFEWTGSTSTMKKYYYAGSLCIAMRVGINLTATGLTWLFSDHLGSVIRTQSASSSTVYTNRTYKPWGEQSSGTNPTTRGYTGQIEEPNLGGIYFYNARWYDPYLNRFLSPDPIVPGTGVGNNPNAVGYVANANYSALVVDYHENQFLEQLNQENRIRLADPRARFPSVPTNPLAFDRYAYCFNNPVRYNDPSGHCPGCAVAMLGGVGFTISAPVLIIGGLVVVAGIVAYDTFAPGREQRHAEISAGLTSLTNQATQAANGIQALFAKGEYVPSGLNEAERNAYREAVHRYKKAFGLGAADNVSKQTLDKIAEGIKKGLSPRKAADEAPAPPETDD